MPWRAKKDKRPPPKKGAPRRNYRRERFVAHFLACGNGRKAAELAGYSPRTAHAIACHLLKEPDVIAAIEAGQRKVLDLAQVTAVDVVRELARVGFADVSDYVAWGPTGITLRDSADLSRDATAAVAEVSERPTPLGAVVRFKLHSKVEALTQLGRKFGIFKDHVEVEAGQRLRAAMDEASAKLERRLASLAAGQKRAENGRAAKG